MSYHLESIPNRNSRPTLLIREAWREGKRIRKKTRANLTGMPEPLVNGIRALLKGGIALESVEDAFTIRRALPHGHVAAGLATLRRLGLVRLLHRHPGRGAGSCHRRHPRPSPRPGLEAGRRTPSLP